MHERTFRTTAVFGAALAVLIGGCGARAGLDDAGAIATDASTGATPAGASSGTTTPEAEGWATAIAVGGNGACALSPAGRVRCWGQAALLGQGETNAPADRPVEITGLADASAIAVGSTPTASFACAITTLADQVWCWGDGFLGELGDGATPSASPPVPVAGLSDVRAISAGSARACALLASGNVACWGVDDLARGSDRIQTEPVRVEDLPAATAVSVGDGVTCAVVTGGRPMCWGYGGEGGLGDGNRRSSRTPVTVSGLEDVKLVSAGYDAGCAIDVGGVAWCWGRGAAGLGAPAPDTPHRVPGFGGDVATIAAGENTRCGVTTRGNTRCWGRALNGLLGNGSQDADANTAVEVESLPPARDVAVSSGKACALTTSGDVFCWGLAPVGDGTHESSDVAVRVVED